jgi:rhodanese-related sulfurtransferase
VVTTIDTDEVERRVGEGAQLLEVLPADAYRTEHLPGAVNIPMPDLTREAARRALDPSRPVIAYCYDAQCDLSARAAALLEVYGFDEVYDYATSKVAWLAMGLPYEGSAPVEARAGTLARTAATCTPDTPTAEVGEPGPGGVVLVVDERSIVLGALRAPLSDGSGTPAVDVAHPAPSSVRPSILADELARSMDDQGESYVVVSRLDGTLLGIVERADLHVDR